MKFFNIVQKIISLKFSIVIIFEMVKIPNKFQLEDVSLK